MDLDRETEWDLQSIKRYEKLLMFEAEYPVRQMELLGVGGRLVCLGDRAGRRGGTSPACLLTVFSLPPRLGLDNDGASLSPHFDLKIVAGTLNENFITQISCAGKQEKIVASERGSDRLLVYSIASDSSDKLITSGILSCKGLTNPRIAASGNAVFACGHSCSKISFLDIMSGNKVGERRWVGTETELAPLIVGPTSLLVYSWEDATAALYDTRRPEPVSVIQAGDKGEGAGWTAGCGYEEGVGAESTAIAFLSESGRAKFYDLRRPAAPRTHIDLGSQLEPPERDSTSPDVNGMHTCGSEAVVKGNPLDSSVVAVGGLDSRIYVINTEPSCSIKFIHDGHEHMESCLGSGTRTSHHVFYSPGGDRALISAADNSSVNCWSYNDSA